LAIKKVDVKKQHFSFQFLFTLLKSKKMHFKFIEISILRQFSGAHILIPQYAAEEGEKIDKTELLAK
jgi:hypothetical protein